MHPCEDDIVIKASQENVPYFNAPIFLENKQQIGKVDDVLGPIKEYVSSLWIRQFICFFMLKNHSNLKQRILSDNRILY